MYTKLYRGIVDGSLYGRREALTVFFVMLALADQEGIVDVLPRKIADILGETEDFVTIGLAELSAPDPISRTPTAEGRRILPLNEHRTWGWKITNYEAYRKIRDEEQRREYQRQWDRNKRKRPTTNPTASDKSDHIRPKTTNTEAKVLTTLASSEKISLSAEGVWQNIPNSLLATWQKGHPAVNIETELSKAAAWIMANPKNRKNNYARFFTNWLSRSQDNAPRQGKTPRALEACDKVFGPMRAKP